MSRTYWNEFGVISIVRVGTLIYTVNSPDDFMGTTFDILPENGILVIDRMDSQGILTPISSEYISYDGFHEGTIHNITRGINGSMAQAHPSGARIELVSTLEYFETKSRRASVDRLKRYFAARLRPRYPQV